MICKIHYICRLHIRGIMGILREIFIYDSNRLATPLLVTVSQVPDYTQKLAGTITSLL